MDYPGKVITKNQVTPTQTSATGVWTLDDAAAAVKNNNWPVAGVPNPISKSLRFNTPDAAYLNRTPASASNRKTWTWSGWVKRSVIGSAVQQGLIGCSSGTTDSTFMNFQFTGDRLGLGLYTQYILLTTQLFRDVGAWYHIVVALDTTNATADNRCRMYINGVEVTVFTTRNNPTLNADYGINQATQHDIGRAEYTNSTCMGGYMTEINFIDGQALTPSSFGMTDPVTGVWEPLKYSGTYGTNGFYLNFKDATSTTTLGLDYSGNSNTWTTNNFSVTAGAGNDSLTDVPTPWIVYNTTGDVGGVVRGNYCTLNPLDEPSTYAAAGTPVNGNLDFSVSNDAAAGATFAVSSGKWYWEMTVVSGHTAGSNTIWTAITSINPSSSNKLAWQSGSGSRSYATTGLKFNENTSSSYGNTYTNGDVIGCALDLDNGKVYWSKNGTFQASGDPVAGTNAAFTGLTGTWLPEATQNAGVTAWNFGQRPFAYTPPSGFRSLCTTNLPASTVLKGSDYFNPILWTGDGANPRSLTGVGFQPDFVWIKSRSNAYAHRLADAVRGVGRELFSNSTSAEVVNNNNGSVQAFNSDGFTLSGSTSTSDVNGSGLTFVAWNWKANGAGVTNTAGSITSTVSANTTSGFSIVTYTGTGSNATIGHGLGVAPSMVIVKNRSTTTDWLIYHVSLGATKSIAFDTAAAITSSTRWNDTAPTSTLVSIGTSAGVNGSGNSMVAYCFAAISGFSAFGSYTGNGSADGPFVYLGFRPEFVMIKSATTAGTSWEMFDNARETSNLMDLELLANSANAEGTYTFGDFVSNGFKLRSTNNGVNQSSATLIYMAFAENPFKYALAR